MRDVHTHLSESHFSVMVSDSGGRQVVGSPGCYMLLGEGLSRRLVFDDYFSHLTPPRKRYTKEPQNVT